MRIKLFTRLFLLFFLLTSCASEDNEVIKIGSILPLTGPAAIYGEQVKAGQEKALKYFYEQSNQNVNIKLIFQDGAGTPKESLNAYMKLYSQGIKIYTTTTSPVSLSLLTKSMTDSVILFADAAHPDITKTNNKLIFRHSNTTEQESYLISTFIKDNNYKKVAFIILNDDYGVSSEKLLFEYLSKDLNVQIVFKELYDKSQIDFNLLISKVGMVKPDVIVLVGSGPSMGNIIKGIKEYNIKSDIIASIGFIITSTKETIQTYSDYINYVNFDFKYSINQNNDIQPFETLGYGTTLLLCEAIAKMGNGNPADISEYIRSLDRYDTGIEIMKISPTNDILPELRMEMRIK